MALEKPLASKALDALETNLNNLFLHTGSIFNEAANCDDWTIVRPRTQTQKALPEALNGFQDALDDLESELIRARTFILQDRRMIRDEGQSYTSYGANVAPSTLAVSATSIKKTMEKPVGDAEQISIDSEIGMDSISSPSKEGIAEAPSEILTRKAESTREKVSSSSTDRSQDSCNELQAASEPEDSATKTTDMIKAPAVQEESSLKEPVPASKVATATDRKQEEPSETTWKMEKPDTDSSAVDTNSLFPGFELYANSNGTEMLDGIESLDEFSTDQMFGNTDLLDKPSGSIDQANQDSFDAAAFTDSMLQEIKNVGTNDMDDFVLGNFGSDNADEAYGEGTLDDTQFDDIFFTIDGT